MRLTEATALQFAINTALSMGAEVLAHTPESNRLALRHGANTVVIDINELHGLDKESARHKIETKIKYGDLPETRWNQYINHAVLLRKHPGMMIQDVRVDALSPTGKYVRFLDLRNNQYFWSPVEDYEILEDLGRKVITHPVKPVAPQRNLVQTPLN
jgi:hypothetical protein